MKFIKKIHQYNMDLFLPLVAVLLGIVIMGLKKPISVQASMAIPMPQSFLGEYSYDGINWDQLESHADILASNGDLYLRGHFERAIPEDSRLYFYCDHIGGEIYINGELLEQDILLEIEKYGVSVQPSMCSREWKFYYFPEEVPTDALVEIHIKNPHAFGNTNAYQYFLDSLCCTPNEQDILAKNLQAGARPFYVIGIILSIVGVLLLCAVLVSAFMRVPIGITVAQNGLLAAFTGIYFLLDTIDISFRSESHILNTYGWQICMMYSVYFLGIMARGLLEERRKQVAICVVALNAVADIGMILMSFTGVVLIYDTLRLWVILQWVSCSVLFICCLAELLSGKKNRIDLVMFMLIFVCILLDSTGITNSIYSRNSMTKVSVILLFSLKFVQFARSMIFNFRASSQAHKLEKELEESRIALMLSQIQPHFIFNILGTIRGLCRENPEQAWIGLGDFSSYLRANMNALTNEKFIPFERELAHVEAYIRLEQMRMGEKLNVVYDIREKEFSLPPLMLQPLVENAVKHGLFYKANGGRIIIRSGQMDGNIILSVQDDGVGFDAAAKEADFDQREHHGLRNVRSRAEKMLGGSLRIESHPEQGSTVTLEFPADNHS